MDKLKYHMVRAIYHTKQSDKWLALYEEEQTSTRRILIEHHIHLAQFHVDKVKNNGGVV